MILGFLIPVTNRAEQAICDAMLSQMIKAIAMGMGAGPDFQTIAGLDDIGEARSGISSAGQMGSLTMRYDTVGFRRGEVITILIVGYPDGDELAMAKVNLALLFDERVMESLAP